MPGTLARLLAVASRRRRNSSSNAIEPDGSRARQFRMLNEVSGATLVICIQLRNRFDDRRWACCASKSPSVIANRFEKVYKMTVRSLIPGSDAIDVDEPEYLISK